MARGGAFWAGLEARVRGWQASTCPHPYGSHDRDEWLEGWYEEGLDAWLRAQSVVPPAPVKEPLAA